MWGRGIELITIYVFSDSHGCSSKMIRVLEEKQPDLCLFLGDGEADFDTVRERFPSLRAESVCGNCDRFSQAPKELHLTVGGKRIMAVHGHEYNVKWDRDLMRLRYSALEKGEDVVLFGHTHSACREEDYVPVILNPGSAGYGSGASYGIITIDGAVLKTELRRI